MFRSCRVHLLWLKIVSVEVESVSDSISTIEAPVSMCVRTISLLTTFYHMNHYAATGHVVKSSFLIKKIPLARVLATREHLLIWRHTIHNHVCIIIFIKDLAIILNLLYLPIQCDACQRRWESTRDLTAAGRHREQVAGPAPQTLLPAKSGRKTHPYTCR